MLKCQEILFFGRLADIAFRRVGDDRLFNFVVDQDGLINADATLVAQAVALRTTDRCPVLLFLHPLQVTLVRNAGQDFLHQLFFSALKNGFLLTGLTEGADQTLGDGNVDRRAHDFGVNAQVKKPRERAGGIVGVKRREH